MSHSGARSRSSVLSPVLVAMLVIFAFGCASAPSQVSSTTFPKTSICTTTRCMLEAAMEPYYQTCIAGLFNRSAQRSVREAIYEEFRYPFSDASGYFHWMRMGGSGPAPQEWCRHYAYRKVTAPYGRGLSLN